ncbi:hypothetical protein CCACVL1_30967 [Corchorus capsularis]|uniref:DWNN domain-containing protein n=1 Tax=Corchorus capsularis TaxID=210143 RepID=A0A1R3FUH9_COCAP|nr:hypothetical protein CCACVL1_30967 [Corchorus capsularis]
MSVRIRFRSSLDSKYVDFSPWDSMSVRDLRSRIAERKRLHSSRDYLHLFDSTTGKEYLEEEFLIPSGTSLILKRAPLMSSKEEDENGGKEEVDDVKKKNLVIISEKSATLPLNLNLAAAI